MKMKTHEYILLFQCLYLEVLDYLYVILNMGY